MSVHHGPSFVRIEGGGDNTVDDCTFEGAGWVGVEAIDTANVRVMNSRFATKTAVRGRGVDGLHAEGNTHGYATASTWDRRAVWRRYELSPYDYRMTYGQVE